MPGTFDPRHTIANNTNVKQNVIAAVGKAARQNFSAEDENHAQTLRT
jgi:hypothetical protein